MQRINSSGLIVVLIAVFLLAISPITFCFANSFAIKPYLQSVQPSNLWIYWETASSGSSTVLWGETSTLTQSTNGHSVKGQGTSRIHQVHLIGLKPDTIYYYQVKTDDLISEVYQFKTPALAAAEQSSRILAMSDMQNDLSNSMQFKYLVEDAIVPYVRDTLKTSLHQGLSLTLIPGDLVDDGNDYQSWRHTFFTPIAPLAAQVPIYPVLGNHEKNSENYFKFFRLPENGSKEYLEHWYYFDHSNIRIIALDSNQDYQITQQLKWLDKVLAQTCEQTEIDFVFAQMHHPHRSELWGQGETDFSGQIVAKLEQFSSRCNKPSIHFFGHTHAYSRGASRDHHHAMVNVASAGGNLDYFGEGDYIQQDYTEFAVSQDEYGYVLVDVAAGEDPWFEVKRISIGDENNRLNNVERDAFRVRKNNAKPYTPTILWPSSGVISPQCSSFAATLFADSDQDEFAAAHWQLSHTCDDFSAPLIDKWYQRKNIWNEIDTRAGKPHNHFSFGLLDSNSNYCARVRYRDESLSWSDWSAAKAFTTNKGSYTDNLLQNGDAEQGKKYWRSTGLLESLAKGQCDGISPYQGKQYFAVGGLCAKEASEALAVQRVELKAFSKEIAMGDVMANFAGFMRNWEGKDNPQIQILLLDSQFKRIGESEVLSSFDKTWRSHQGQIRLPVNTHYIDFVLKGHRNAGTDNDSYFDNLSLKLDLAGERCPSIDSVIIDGIKASIATGIPEAHITGSVTNSENLLQNPDAELGTSGWSGMGTIEALTSTQCSSVPVKHGEHFFAVGGICRNESAVGQVFQRISVQAYHQQIMASTAKVQFGGVMRNHEGHDEPAIELHFINANGDVITTSEKLSGKQSRWQQVQAQQTIPQNTVFIDFMLTGIRNQGTDNDSYFDNLMLRVLVD